MVLQIKSSTICCTLLAALAASGGYTSSSMAEVAIRREPATERALVATGSALAVAVSTTAPVPASAASAASAAATTPPADYVQITRVVGEANERFVTSREVRLNNAINQAFLQVLPQGAGLSGDIATKAQPNFASGESSQVPAATEPASILTGQEKAFPQEVARVLDEWAIYLEAKALATGDVSRPDLARVQKAVQDFWEGKPAWQALEVSPQELREFTERKLIARSFLALKSDSSLTPISDSDASQYYRRNRLRFGSVPFSSVKEPIRAFLLKQQTEKRLEDWKDVLRRKYKIRNFLAG